MKNAFDGRRVVLEVARWPVGGIRTYLRDLFRAPALQGYSFVLVAPNEDGLHEYIAALKLDRFRWISTGPSFYEMTRMLSGAIRQWRPMLVHSHGFVSGVISSLACEFTGVPHIQTVHDVLLEEQFRGLAGRIRDVALGSTFFFPNVIHCVTADSRDNLVSRYPWLLSLKRKVVVIRHGIDAEKIVLCARRDIAADLGCSSNTVIFGFLGRYMAQKGFRILIDAIAILRERGFAAEQLRILAVGSGGFLREDRARIESLGLAPYFTFWPYQPEIASILKGIHCLVMPSLWEASGLLAMEAMVAGTPVIGTNCIGLRETLADSPSVQVQPNEPHQLSEAIANFVSKPDRGSAARFQQTAVERFAADRSFRELSALYDQHARLR